jgi:Fungal chitosanase of glycosyl hydrolase group 75
MLRPGMLILTALLLGSMTALGKTQAASTDQGTRSRTPACARHLLFNTDLRHYGDVVGEVSIWEVAGGSAFFFETNMAIDADGAPDAYNPDNTGLDDLESAGEPGHWWALAIDKSTGKPYLQGPSDPDPGYYISTTALWDGTKKPGDPRRYVDASAIPYIVLPHEVAWETGARLGDFAVVFNLRDGTRSGAIFADTGPSVGEGSIALAENLGIRSNPRRGGAREGILYLVFPGSGNGKPRTLDEINNEAEGLLRGLGGPDWVAACAMN